MKIFNIFKKKNYNNQPEIEKDERGIYFHEDSFNQVEFMPRENLLHLKTENEKIEKFGEENFDGIGFKDIYARSENPLKIADRRFSFEKLDKMFLELEMEKNSEVFQGYSSARWKCENTFAYTYGEAQIFVSQENDFVYDFWIDGFRFHKDLQVKTKLKDVLLKIGNEMDLVLNDWDLTLTIDLKNESEIVKYLNEEF